MTEDRSARASASPHRVVIVGGGAGGLPLATALGDKLGRRGKAAITLVDRAETHVWKPLLHEVAAGRMDAAAHDVDYLAVAYWHGFRFRQGAVESLNRARRELKVGSVDDDDGRQVLPGRSVPYDTLIFCIGSTTNDFGIPGVAAYAISLDTPLDAERFHRRLLAAAVRADGEAAEGRPSHVDIVIIGAGATGVELAAEIRQTTRTHALYGLDKLDPARDIRLTLLEAAPRILPQLGERIAKAATELLGRLGIAVLTGERVVAVDEEGVHTADGTTLRADLIVWAAGIQAPPLLAQLDGLEVNRANQLVVTATLQTTRDPDVFAFGDCAAAPWLGRGKEGALVPPRAQAARQQAALLVRTMRARLDGAPLPEFYFHDFGSLVSLGELSAVGNLMGRLIGGSMLIQGLIARAMYASLYKLHQASIHGYFRVALDTIGRFLRRRMEPRVKLH
ncbi:MAG TPA: NAD(P)/FAD-dependent oxidoreductase [Casimicrobiaceae bacterium]|nr:NAD(P)/FAD-dependent oxidoreductase [Casimicrobiaceae bacterium]